MNIFYVAMLVFGIIWAGVILAMVVKYNLDKHRDSR